jgi:hypothetical protein
MKVSENVTHSASPKIVIPGRGANLPFPNVHVQIQQKKNKKREVPMWTIIQSDASDNWQVHNTALEHGGGGIAWIRPYHSGKPDTDQVLGPR